MICRNQTIAFHNPGAGVQRASSLSMSLISDQVKRAAQKLENAIKSLINEFADFPLPGYNFIQPLKIFFSGFCFIKKNLFNNAHLVYQNRAFHFRDF